MNNQTPLCSKFPILFVKNQSQSFPINQFNLAIKHFTLKFNRFN